MVVLDRSFLERLYPDLESIFILNLQSRGISSIASDAFAGLSNLTHLDLSGNCLTAIAPRTFDELSNLTTLSLCNTNLTIIVPGTFVGLPKLKYLGLSKNHLTFLAPGTFAGLPSLVHLFLYNNHLTSLAPGTFTGLPSLTMLSLSRNQLTFLAPGTFAELPSSAELYLYRNQLTELALDTFGTLAYRCHAERFLTKRTQNLPVYINDEVVDAMAALFPDANLHRALASVSQLQTLAVFKSDHHPAGYRDDKWCSPLRVRLLLLCKYVRDAYELDTYRYCSAEQLQRIFHLRAKLARTAKNPLGDRMLKDIVYCLCEW